MTPTRTHPWPSMRGSMKNEGRASVPAEIKSDLPVRVWQTGNAIFSTPVIDADERVCVGSADEKFYCFDPLTGKTVWTFATEGVVDSAACIADGNNIYVPCGDASIYKLSPEGSELWRLDLLRKRYGTGSTIFWWEGNIVPGPNGLLYAGNDDFCVYAITPEGHIHWATPTGLQIWGACGFAGGLVFCPSFDMHIYALNQETGSIVWSRPIGNFVSSSPAIAEDGSLTIAGFDGVVTQLDTKTGRKRWSVHLHSAIYASAALTPDGALIIGTAEGMIYRLDVKTGKTLEKYITGSPVWSSASIGFDPEHPESYLIYIGTAAGEILALDPQMQHRWTYDIPSGLNVNASPALGHHGLAIASAGGEAIYIPYDAYLRPTAEHRFRRTPRPIAPEGRDLLPLIAEGTPTWEHDRITLPVGAPLCFQLDPRRNGDRVRTKELRAKAMCDRGDVLLRVYTVENRLDLLPTDLTAGEQKVRVDVQYKDPAGVLQKTHADVTVERMPGTENPAMTTGAQMRITKMHFEIPAIVTPFDQIGIASLSITVGVIRHDPESGRFVAWGAQTFGVSESGKTVGIPNPRQYVYAFSGFVENGAFFMEANACDFDITAFPIPLNRFAFMGIAKEGKLIGTSCHMELGRRGLVSTIVGRYGFRAAGASGDWIRSLRAMGHVWLRIQSVLRTGWVMTRLLFGRKWLPWGLLDVDGNLSAIGGFQIDRISPASPHSQVHTFTYNASSRTVSGTLTGYHKSGYESVMGIVLIDTDTMKPVVLPYNTLLKRVKHADGSLTVTLTIPRSVTLTPNLEALLMEETNEIGRISLA